MVYYFDCMVEQLKYILSRQLVTTELSTFSFSKFMSIPFC